MLNRLGWFPFALVVRLGAVFLCLLCLGCAGSSSGAACTSSSSDDAGVVGNDSIEPDPKDDPSSSSSPYSSSSSPSSSSPSSDADPTFLLLFPSLYSSACNARANASSRSVSLISCAVLFCPLPPRCIVLERNSRARVDAFTRLLPLPGRFVSGSAGVIATLVAGVLYGFVPGVSSDRSSTEDREDEAYVVVGIATSSSLRLLAAGLLACDCASLVDARRGSVDVFASLSMVSFLSVSLVYPRKLQQSLQTIHTRLCCGFSSHGN